MNKNTFIYLFIIYLYGSAIQENKSEEENHSVAQLLFTRFLQIVNMTDNITIHT